MSMSNFFIKLVIFSISACLILSANINYGFLSLLDTPNNKNYSSEKREIKEPIKTKEDPPSVDDLVACMNDIKPVISDIFFLVQSYKKEDKARIASFLLKLTTDGYTLGEACKKVISAFLQ